MDLALSTEMSTSKYFSGGEVRSIGGGFVVAKTGLNIHQHHGGMLTATGRQVLKEHPWKKLCGTMWCDGLRNQLCRPGHLGLCSHPGMGVGHGRVAEKPTEGKKIESGNLPAITVAEPPTNPCSLR